MDPITILFFAIASMIGMEDSRILSRKVTVTINPVDKTFDVRQEDLFSIVMLPEDSLAVVGELHGILTFDNKVKNNGAIGLVVDHILFSKNDQQLDARITGHYTDPKTLGETGINLDTLSMSEFSLINFTDWNFRSPDAVLQGNYWVWPADKPITFVLEPFENVPATFLKHRQSVLTYYDHWLKK